MITWFWMKLLAGAVSVATLAAILLHRRHRMRQARRVEDGLKAILAAELERRVLDAASLAGILGIRYESTLRLIEYMHAKGLVRWGAAGLELDNRGRQTAIRLLRAHRLTESFLANEAGMEVDRVHREADRAEHRITENQLAELNERLGHPDSDPHGDLIPDAAGKVPHADRYYLTDWPEGRPAVVAHVEDEPPRALRRLLTLGIRPGVELEAVSRSRDAVTVCIKKADIPIPTALARQVQVSPLVIDSVPVERPRFCLAKLAIGRWGRVVRIEDACRGLARRRLLDLGITPGAPIRPELANAGESARAYRIRETIIALRREQSEQILVENAMAPRHADVS